MKHRNCDNDTFKSIVNLRAQGLTWKEISKQVSYNPTSAYVAALNYAKQKFMFSTPEWIMPSILDLIIEAVRRKQPPPIEATPEQIKEANDRALRYGFVSREI